MTPECWILADPDNRNRYAAEVREATRRRRSGAHVPAEFLGRDLDIRLFESPGEAKEIVDRVMPQVLVVEPEVFGVSFPALRAAACAFFVWSVPRHVIVTGPDVQVACKLHGEVEDYQRWYSPGGSRVFRDTRVHCCAWSKYADPFAAVGYMAVDCQE